MNKELYREKIGLIIKDVKVGENIEFIKEDDTKITLSDHHDQGCCESVYADFDAIKYYQKDIVGKKFEEMLIKSVDGMGFLICLYQDWEKGEKIFIPCYNIQNGYYGSNLELIINGNIKIDISDSVEDHIY